MAGKEIVIPLDKKMLVIEALSNYERLVVRRFEAEKFETVRRELAKSADEVKALRRLVEAV